MNARIVVLEDHIADLDAAYRGLREQVQELDDAALDAAKLLAELRPEDERARNAVNRIDYAREAVSNYFKGYDWKPFMLGRSE